MECEIRPKLGIGKIFVFPLLVDKFVIIDKLAQHHL